MEYVLPYSIKGYYNICYFFWFVGFQFWERYYWLDGIMYVDFKTIDLI